MKTRAAVAFQAGKPLEIVEVDLEGPRPGEVLVEIKATGVCHTDAFTLSGDDPEGAFPAILGHEGAGVVVEVGPGVKSVKPGDHVIPLYTPECRECDYCLHPKTNLCQAIRSTQGQGVMPDGSSRFSLDGKPLLHYMGCSTFSNYTVLPEIALAKVREDAPFDKICYIGCGVTTGIGAVAFTMKVEPGSTVAVFGLGGIGLNVVQGAKMVGATRIIGIDLNPGRVELAKKFGMTDFVNPIRGGRRGAAPDRHDRRRGGLQLRVYRQRQGHAPGAGVLPQGLGPELHHRCRRRGPGDLHPSVPAGHRSRLARQRLRRRPRSHRCAAESSTGTWRARSISTT